MRTLLLLLILPALLLAEEREEEKPKRKTAGELEIPDPGTAIEDSAVARKEVARFLKEWKSAQGAEQKIKALTRLGGFDHSDILKAATKHTKDRDHTIAIAAVVVIARQSRSKVKAGKTLLGVLRKEKRNHVICAALVGMGRLGYDHKSAVKEAIEFFRRDTKETHKAATRYFGYIKYKNAFRMLAEKLDEPVAEKVNDPMNPSTAWWKERWIEWKSNVEYTRWALSELVEGETFETKNEAREWVETEGKAYGLEW